MLGQALVERVQIETDKISFKINNSFGYYDSVSMICYCEASSYSEEFATSPFSKL